MADSIVVKVSDLYRRAKQMKDDGMDFVEITILDEEKSDSDFIPACLSLNATSKEQDFMTDYEYIESCEEE